MAAPSSGSSTASAARACPGSVAARSASTRLPQHRPGEPPRLGAFREERARREHRHRAGPAQLGQQPRLARPGHAAEQHELARGHGGRAAGPARPPGRRRRAPRTRAPGRPTRRTCATSPRSSARCSRSTSGDGSTPSSSASRSRSVASGGQRTRGIARRRQRLGQHEHGRLGEGVVGDRVGGVGGRGARVAEGRRGTRGEHAHLGAGPAQALPGRAGPGGVGVLGQRLAPQRERFGAGRRGRRGVVGTGAVDRRQELVDVDGAPSAARTPRCP